MVERAEQLPPAPGVKLTEFAWIPAGMGHVAAPAAGDANLLQYGFAPFQYDDPFVRVLLRPLNSGKKARRAAADDEGDGGRFNDRSFKETKVEF